MPCALWACPVAHVQIDEGDTKRLNFPCSILAVCPGAHGANGAGVPLAIPCCYPEERDWPGTALSRRATGRKPREEGLESGCFLPHARTCPSGIDADVPGCRRDRPIACPKSRNKGHRLIRKKSVPPHGGGNLYEFCRRVGSPLSSRLPRLGETGLPKAKEAR